MTGDSFARNLQRQNLRWFLKKVLAERKEAIDEEVRSALYERFLHSLDKYLQRMEGWLKKESVDDHRTVGNELSIAMERRKQDSNTWTRQKSESDDAWARIMARMSDFNCPHLPSFPMKDTVWLRWMNRTADNAVLSFGSDHAPVMMLKLNFWTLSPQLQGMGLMKLVFSSAIVMSYRSELQQKIEIASAYLPTVLLTDSFWAVSKKLVDVTRFVPTLTELYWCPAVLGAGVKWDTPEFSSPEASDLVWTPASLRAEMRYMQTHNEPMYVTSHIPRDYGRMLHEIERWVALTMDSVTRKPVTKSFVAPSTDIVYSHSTWYEVTPFSLCELTLQMVDDLDFEKGFYTALMKAVPYHTRRLSGRIPVLFLRDLWANCSTSDPIDYTNQVRVFVSFLVDMARDLGLPLVLALPSGPDNAEYVTQQKCYTSVSEMQTCRVDRVSHLSARSPERYDVWPMKEWSWPTDVAGMGPAPVFVENTETGELWFYPQSKHRSFVIPPELIERTLKEGHANNVTYDDVLSCVKPPVLQEKAPIQLVTYIDHTTKRSQNLLPAGPSFTAAVYPCSHCATHGAQMLHPTRPLEVFCNQHCYSSYMGNGYEPF